MDLQHMPAHRWKHSCDDLFLQKRQPFSARDHVPSDKQELITQRGTYLAVHCERKEHAPTWAMWVLAACFCTKAVYLASSHRSSVSSSMLMAASSGNSLGTVGARLGDIGGRATTFGLPAAYHTVYISSVPRTWCAVLLYLINILGLSDAGHEC